MAFMSNDLQRSKGHTGVTEVKNLFYLKKFQLKQETSNFDVFWARELSLVGALKLNHKLNSEVIKGHFRVKFENIFKKSLKINGRC